MTAPLHELGWMAEQIKKSTKWVLNHLDEIPHRRVGRSVMFSDEDYQAYVDSIARRPTLMVTTGRRRSA